MDTINIRIDLTSDERNSVLWALRDAAVDAAHRLFELQTSMTPELLDQLEASGSINGYEAEVDMTLQMISGCRRTITAMSIGADWIDPALYLSQIDEALASGKVGA
jgi:hypothetical protein